MASGIHLDGKRSKLDLVCTALASLGSKVDQAATAATQEEVTAQGEIEVTCRRDEKKFKI